MRRAVFAFLACALGVFGASPLFAYLAPGKIVLKLDVIGSSTQSPEHVLCSASLDTQALERLAITVKRSIPATDDAPSADSPSHWTCSVEPGQGLSPARLRENSGDQLVGQISIEASPRRHGEDERSIQVRLDSQWPDHAAYAEYRPNPGFSRELWFSDDATTFIPVVTSGEDFKIHPADELLLKLQTSLEPRAERSRFGRITILSRVEDTHVLLDGGLVGLIPDTGSLDLQLITPGMRLLTLEAPSGQIEQRFLRIRSGRAYFVAFGGNGSEYQGAGTWTTLHSTGTNDRGFPEYRRSLDGAEMILVPEGEFLMGNRRTERTPFEHLVYLSSFLIDKTAVTWRQYQEFLSSTGQPMPPHDPYWGVQPDHPAVYVTWQEAREYCQWVGGRLPTEAEREKAARGTDQRLWPWGEQAPTPELGVYRRQWGSEATDPVGIRPLGASPYGALDMGGNVWEWCLDWYSDPYLEASPYLDPPGPETGETRVLRGGSWDSRPDVLSASCRNWGHPGYREGDFGFRCAMSAPRR